MSDWQREVAAGAGGWCHRDRVFSASGALAVRGESESLFGHGGPTDIATEPFEFAAGVRLGGDACAQGESAGLGKCIALF